MEIIAVCTAIFAVQQARTFDRGRSFQFGAQAHEIIEVQHANQIIKNAKLTCIEYNIILVTNKEMN